jgi:hypothetical protein
MDQERLKDWRAEGLKRRIGLLEKGDEDGDKLVGFFLERSEAFGWKSGEQAGDAPTKLERPFAEISVFVKHGKFTVFSFSAI